MNINDFLNLEPYSLNKEEKTNFFNTYLNYLTKYHYNHCTKYKNIIDSLSFDIKKTVSYDEIPFLPVRLFKIYDLYSINKKDIIKTMTSSGTSGQDLSKIFLDKQTSINQSKVLTKIISEFIGLKRTPMIIIDSSSILKNRNMFSARGAGILGFSMFGTKRIYALDENMKLEVDNLISFIKEHDGSRIFIFGFTYMVFQHFIKQLEKKKINIDLSNAVMIHGGGWKKLEAESISSKEFRSALNKLCGIKKVYDYYGMVEQTGSIYMECEYGNLHASVFSDILVRSARDFSILPVGKQGIIQTVSILPKSYPGHLLITEDEGVLLGEDDCKCGRLGKYFHIFGRMESAELRGCGDTYAEEIS
tara:strand:- start:151 stop:1233 length:1083 start_codon:yes stop_codon:yes gene_type:complete